MAITLAVTASRCPGNGPTIRASVSATGILIVTHAQSNSRMRESAFAYFGRLPMLSQGFLIRPPKPRFKF
jgi:hypothetical protein